jgi:uridine kinase
MTRAIILDDLAARILRLQSGRPIRIAIDGRTASGKTTLANELTARISAKHRPVIHTSIDDFHRPKAMRYARGRNSAEGYYYNARDLSAMMTLLLAPLGPNGDRRYRTASFDLASDRPLSQAAQLAPADAILIVDGTFLQRPELRDGWDLTIFIEVSPGIATARGIARDANQLGGIEAARQLYAERYDPACDLYERLCTPDRIADVILNNDDPERPGVRFRPDGRLANPRTVT